MSSLCTIGGTSFSLVSFFLANFVNYYLFVDRPNLYVQPVVVLFFRSRTTITPPASCSNQNDQVCHHQYPLHHDFIALDAKRDCFLAIILLHEIDERGSPIILIHYIEHEAPNSHCGFAQRGKVHFVQRPHRNPGGRSSQVRTNTIQTKSKYSSVGNPLGLNGIIDVHTLSCGEMKFTSNNSFAFHILMSMTDSITHHMRFFVFIFVHVHVHSYPFCTIEPNTGIVSVPDEKLEVLSKLNKSAKTVPATLEFVDVAGLIKGASAGEGLGNEFLATIRQCDAIVHVVRCFEDEDVIHVDGSVDPIRDAELINLELAFADLAQVEKRMERLKKDRKADPLEKSALEKIQAVLMDDKPARNAELTDDEELAIKSFGLLTKKKMIYAANVADTDLADGNEMVERLRAMAEPEGAKVVVVSAQVEAELVELDAESRAEFLESLGVSLQNTGLRQLVKEAYDLLGLQTYYTSGETESRAWTIQKGWTAPKAAGVIHNDFERGFIRAETVSYNNLVECGSELEAKNKGLLRSEGKDYVVQEGDVSQVRCGSFFV